MKLYYAHPISMYNSHQERRDLQLLAQMGFEVLNPNQPEHSEAYIKGGRQFSYFLQLVDTCDGVAFRGFPDGSIPSGVWQEVDRAKTMGNKPVIELPSGVARRALSHVETIEYLQQVGAR
jgi:hypothetical protein